jgi:hypothetical protein
VKNPPDGFIKWAKGEGAVSIESYDEWQKFVIDKEKQEADNNKEDRKKER